MGRAVDLHVHTSASDGTTPPEALPALAAERGLAAVAVTDHDTMAGAVRALAARRAGEPEIVPGIEVSAQWGEGEIHLLGYFPDPDSPALAPVLTWAAAERGRRNALMAGRLRDAGYDVTLDALRARHPGAVIGRPHFAGALVRLGAAGSTAEAFEKFLAPGRPFYVPRRYLPPERAAGAILGAGGLPVLAHPLQYGFDGRELRRFAETFRALGAVGLEAIYPGYTPEDTERLRRLAGECGLLITGGSDYHGRAKSGNELGCVDVDYALLEQLRATKILSHSAEKASQSFAPGGAK